MADPPSKKQKRKNTKNKNIINTNPTNVEKLVDGLGEEGPVVSMILNEPITAPIVDPSLPSSLLESLVFPCLPDYFLKACFRRKAVHIHSSLPEGNKIRIEHLIQRYMYGLNPESLIQETSSDNAFVWLQQQIPPKQQHRDNKKGNPDCDEGSSLIRSIEVADTDMAVALHESGHSTYCRAPPEIEQFLVSKLLRETGMGCGQYDPAGERGTELGRGEVEVFMGSTKGHVTDWHYDFQENFTIQLSGSKQWTLKQGKVLHPLRGCTPHYAAPGAVESQLKAARLSKNCSKFRFEKRDESNSFGHEQTVALHAGDVLYFPAGMWHTVKTTDPGISINVSLMAANYATITCQALQHLLLKEDAWRECVVNNSSSDTVEKLQKLLQQELPKIVKKFVENNGAESIIPPVLRHAPTFQIEGAGGEADGERWEEVEEDPKDVEEDDANSEDEQEIDSEDEESSQVVVDNGGEEPEGTVDICDFESPEGWSADPPLGGNYHIVKNPLASLTKMNDITQFYTKQGETNEIDNNQDNDNNLYVLNVNFAGNEMHESTVRVIFKDSSDDKILDHWLLLDPQSSQLSLMPKKDDIPHCLLFYGYLQWSKCKE